MMLVGHSPPTRAVVQRPEPIPARATRATGRARRSNGRQALDPIAQA